MANKLSTPRDKAAYLAATANLRPHLRSRVEGNTIAPGEAELERRQKQSRKIRNTLTYEARKHLFAAVSRGKKRVASKPEGASR